MRVTLSSKSRDPICSSASLTDVQPSTNLSENAVSQELRHNFRFADTRY